VKVGCAVLSGDVDAVQEKDVEMDIRIQRGPKALYLATHAQKPVFEKSASQVSGEFLLPDSAPSTRYSRSTACAEGSSLAAGPGLARMTQDCECRNFWHPQRYSLS
jgi:hypothetical protein